MGATITRILPGLYVSSMECTKDEEELMANCISHVLYVLNEEMIIDKCPGRQQLLIVVQECYKKSFMNQVQLSNDFIHQTRSDGCNVLVTSESGVSTNVAMVMAYLMAIYSIDYSSALNAIRGRLHTANPSSYLKDQLELFDDFGENRNNLDSEFVTASSERLRLFDKFGEWLMIEEDMTVINDALNSHHSLDESGLFFNEISSTIKAEHVIDDDDDDDKEQNNLSEIRLTTPSNFADPIELNQNPIVNSNFSSVLPADQRYDSTLDSELMFNDPLMNSNNILYQSEFDNDDLFQVDQSYKNLNLEENCEENLEEVDNDNDDNQINDLDLNNKHVHTDGADEDDEKYVVGSIDINVNPHHRHHHQSRSLYSRSFYGYGQSSYSHHSNAYNNLLSSHSFHFRNLTNPSFDGRNNSLMVLNKSFRTS